MSTVIGFDVYGTLVDPLAMREPLAEVVGGALAGRAATLWRSKQIDNAFRAALMRRYVDFSECTRLALTHTLRVLGVPATQDAQHRLLDLYRSLPAYPDARQGLEELQASGARLIAFSNGTERAIRTVLGNAGLLALFDDVVSVDDLRTYKPNPDVYDYVVQRGGAPRESTWLVSSNDWDVTGAKNAGLRTAWIKRNPAAVFDPFGLEPDLVAADLADAASQLQRTATERHDRTSG
jgi:2-haloacid dehalogenase